MFFHRQEGHAHAVRPRLRQLEAELGALAGEELVWNLDQDAGAVAGLRVAAAGAAVGQVDKNLDSLADNVVALMAADAGDEPDAARVVLVRGIVETLRRRDAGGRVETRHHGLRRVIEFLSNQFVGVHCRATEHLRLQLRDTHAHYLNIACGAGMYNPEFRCTP